ncbi:alkaline phosphatase-like [Glandiceps talaboti]
MARIQSCSFKLYILAVICSCSFFDDSLSQPAEDWNEWAKIDLERALDLEVLNTNIAKNVIVFLGDGMGIPTMTAARIYKGQLEGNPGEEAVLAFESLPRSALIKTYNTDYQVPDSSGTATAILSGIKTKSGVVGVDDSALRYDCDSTKGAEIDSVFKIASIAGKSAGIISTARITHASPASVYSHCADRDWESSAGGDCADIAAQLIEHCTDYQVVLGGGRREFMTNDIADPEYPASMGRRTDGRDLLAEWQDKIPENMVGTYVWKKDDFDAVDPHETDYLFGLFEPSHMQYEADRDDDTAGEPSLTEMVEKAILMLKSNEKGFFLFVEAGRIDHAHHDTRAYGALTDTLAFDDSIAKALEMTDTKDTLTIVTADHGHVVSISGYPVRGNPILGPSGDIADDGLPYTTLGYANGPSAVEVTQSIVDTGYRQNITGTDTENEDYLQQSLVNLQWETHGGEDISLHADGPYSHLFQGVYEQNYIAHVIKYAACLAEHEDRHGCDGTISAGETSLEIKSWNLFN